MQMRSIHYTSGTFSIMANAQAIVDYIRQAYLDGVQNLAGHLNSDWSLDFATIKDLGDPDNPTIPFSFTAGVLQGAIVGEAMPTQTCMLVTFKANLPKPNVKRSYVGGWSEAQHTTTGFGANPIAAATAWGNYLLNMNPGLDPNIEYSVVRIDPLTKLVDKVNPLSILQVGQYARIQRRRTPGRGI